MPDKTPTSQCALKKNTLWSVGVLSALLLQLSSIRTIVVECRPLKLFCLVLSALSIFLCPSFLDLALSEKVGSVLPQVTSKPDASDISGFVYRLVLLNKLE